MLMHEKTCVITIVVYQFYCMALYHIRTRHHVIRSVRSLRVSCQRLIIIVFSQNKKVFRLCKLINFIHNCQRLTVGKADSKLFLSEYIVFEPRHEIFNNVVCATSKDSDQPAYTHILIRAFASRLNIP